MSIPKEALYPMKKVYVARNRPTVSGIQVQAPNPLFIKSVVVIDKREDDRNSKQVCIVRVRCAWWWGEYMLEKESEGAGFGFMSA